ncbi:MAG: iron-sulfur cluster assembly accessory protein [Azospirillaceae bacterium]
MAREMPPLMTISERAAERVRALMAKADGEIVGVRVGVRSTGCSGLSYFMEYAREAKALEDKVVDKGVTILVEPTASMFLIGTQMDWVEEPMGSRFVFNNPNEIDRCGCGESFRVAQQEGEPALQR